MPGTYMHTLFGETSRALQAEVGSRASYARLEAAAVASPDALTTRELNFLRARDSIYLASLTSSGWPYLQHRGGPAGFVCSLGGNKIGFGEYPGNRQFISIGNVKEQGRVSVFAMDYPARRRLKLIGTARVVMRHEDPLLVDQMSHSAGPRPEAAILIDVLGFDWNCPQYIEQRFTREELKVELADVLLENERLRQELNRLKGDHS